VPSCSMVLVPSRRRGAERWCAGDVTFAPAWLRGGGWVSSCAVISSARTIWATPAPPRHRNRSNRAARTPFLPCPARVRPDRPRDEIQPRNSKTQSALLEAMQERTVTVAGATHPLPRPSRDGDPNPIEQKAPTPPRSQLTASSSSSSSLFRAASSPKSSTAPQRALSHDRARPRRRQESRHQSLIRQSHRPRTSRTMPSARARDPPQGLFAMGQFPRPWSINTSARRLPTRSQSSSSPQVSRHSWTAARASIDDLRASTPLPPPPDHPEFRRQAEGIAPIRHLKHHRDAPHRSRLIQPSRTSCTPPPRSKAPAIGASQYTHHIFHAAANLPPKLRADFIEAPVNARRKNARPPSARS